MRLAATLTIAIALGVIVFLTASGAGAQADCTRHITADGGYTGEWGSDCLSENTPAEPTNALAGTRYAGFFSFTLTTSAYVTIDLTSSTDTYMYLMEGIGANGNVLHENDDATANNRDSRIQAGLEAGDYTIEATTYDLETTGGFTLTVEGLPNMVVTPTQTATPDSDASPTPEPTPAQTPTYTPSPTLTLTPAFLPTGTVEPSLTPTQTATYKPTDLESPLPESCIPFAPNTATPEPTPTLTPTPTPEYTETPTSTPTNTLTPKNTPTSSALTTPEPTRTPIPKPTIGESADDSLSSIDDVKTSTSTPTPTLTFEPTATETPTPAAILTPEKLYNVNYIVGDYMSEDDALAVRCGVDLTHDYAVRFGMAPLEDDINVYLLNADDLVDVTVRAGFSRTYSINLWSYALGAYGGNGDVYINASRNTAVKKHIGWLRTSIHEVSHAQRHMSNDLSLATNHPDIPEYGPVWLDEAFSTFHRVRVMTNSGLLPDSYSYYRSFYAEDFLDSPLSLKDLETVEEYHSSDNIFNILFFAGELLLHHAGEEAAYKFYKSLNSETTWDKEFKNNFGFTINEFYELFEEHREAGLPEPEFPKY